MRFFVLIAILLQIVQISEAQEVEEYCSKAWDISQVKLRFNNNYDFTLRNLSVLHGETAEYVEQGTYIMKNDSLRMTVNKFIHSTDSVRAYSEPNLLEGFYAGKKLYFGKGPYMILKKCYCKKYYKRRKRLLLSEVIPE